MARRLTTIIATDIVGYSRLMGADEAGTLAAIKDHRKDIFEPKLDQYGGRVVKLMGDGALLEFASVVDAVQFAVETQLALQDRNAELPEEKQVVYRIGINIGDVIVDGDDIYGDGVNVAARLEGLAEPGGICLSRPVRTQITGKLDLDLEHLGEKQVKNIAEPVSAYRIELNDKAVALLADSAASVKFREPGQSTKRRLPLVAAAAAFLIAVVAGGGWWWWQQPDFEPADPAKYAFKIPDKPSIAVLPFDNLSGDPANDYLGDSLTENVIAELARAPELIVIARNSVFTYKNKPVKVQTVAEDLGVRYVLEGSVQTENDRMRVVAQLVDALNGRHLWSERFDYKANSILDLQDDLTQKITEELQVKLTIGEQARRWREAARSVEMKPEELQMSYQGRVAFQKFNEDGNREAERLWGELYKRYPEHPPMSALMAYIHYQKVRMGFSKDPAASFTKAWELAKKAKELSGDGDDADLEILFGILNLLKGEHEQAVRHIEKAMELAPSAADVYSIGSDIMLNSGHVEKGVEMARTGMRLEPDYPLYVPAQLVRGLTRLGRYEEAKSVANSILALDEPVVEKGWVLSHLAYIALREGKSEEARARVRQHLQINPQISLQGVAAALSVNVDRDFVEAFMNTLRQAGYPETPPQKLPDKPSIAVLPFTNMSDDNSQEYFVDGMTEDLTTRLANVSNLFVIARSTMFTYKGRSVNIPEVGRELGVRYVLEGSVRRSGDQLRINAQLIDAKDGGHLWAKKFDRSGQEIFALQDEVTNSITEALQVKITPEEAKKVARFPTENPAAFDLYLRAKALHHQFDTLGRGSLKKAAELYQEAISEDPEFADAYAGDAGIAAFLVQYYDPSIMSQAQAALRAERSIESALELDPANSRAMQVKAYLLSLQGAHDQAIATARKNVELHPEDAAAIRRYASVLAVTGQQKLALEQIDRAARIDPKPDVRQRILEGWVHFHGRRYAKAAEVFRDVVGRIPQSLLGYYGLAASSAKLGRLEEARAMAGKIFEIFPPANLESDIFFNGRRLRSDIFEHYLEAIKLAGVPQWPYGYQADDTSRLTGEEARDLMWGNTFKGNSRFLGPFEMTFSDDGAWTFRFESVPVVVGGTSFVRAGKLCMHNSDLLNHFCHDLFHKQGSNELIHRTHFDIYSMSLEQ